MLTFKADGTPQMTYWAYTGDDAPLDSYYIQFNIYVQFVKGPFSFGHTFHNAAPYLIK